MKNFKKISILITTITILISCKTGELANKPENKSQNNPNIIIVYFDDLGYGDLSAYGATKIKTPNIDFLANNGLKFTNAYATSATCTPSRYGLLTGVYPWRNTNAKILSGDAPLIVSTNQVTIPKVMKTQGYKTAIIGKWHLGLGNGNVDWNKEIKPNPNDLGFDYSYIMAATQDRVPTVYIKDGFVENLNLNDPIQVNYKENFPNQPTGTSHPEKVKMIGDPQHSNALINGVPRIGFMKGGTSAIWDDEAMADHFTNKVKEYIKENKNNKFFLNYNLQQPHVPRIPHPRFKGKSGMGVRGDVILEADWCIGELIKTLREENLLENTLIILSSDNGAIVTDGYEDEAIELLGNHKPNGVLRGGKYSLFDAGTRVPFISFWKGTIKPNVSDALFSQIDILSSLAALTGSTVTTSDSQNNVNVLLGKTNSGRNHLILEANMKTAYREGDWVLIPAYKGSKYLKNKETETGIAQEVQLYNITQDPSQQKNLAKEMPEKTNQLILNFEKVKGQKADSTSDFEFKN